jgi:pyridoxine 5-phosphate synthase
MKKNIKLGVNIDHAATLRKVRGNLTVYPNLISLIKLIKKAGGDQITIHLREDRRHIQDSDVVELCLKSQLPINLEMAVSKEMLKIALKNKPEWVCYVPEKREELTTEGGLNVEKVFDEIKYQTQILKKNNIKCSYFIEPSIKQVIASSSAGADAVEFHTGQWVLSSGEKKKIIWKKLVSAARKAHELGLRVHAGHGLDYIHTKKVKNLPFLAEVNIGHSIICYSLEEGIQSVCKKMFNCLK